MAKKKPNTGIAQVRKERDIYAWLYEELVHKLRTAAAQQLLEKPEVQQRLQEAVIKQMLAQPPTTGGV